MQNFVGNLSDRLTTIRDHFNYNDSELARICGVSPTAITNLLTGSTQNTKTNVIGELSNKLGINLNWLVNGEGEMFKDGANGSSQNNIVSHSKTKNVSQSQNTGSENTNEVELLRQQVEFLKSQLKFTQDLLEKSMSK